MFGMSFQIGEFTERSDLFSGIYVYFQERV